jgi:hypothetical protein
MGSDTTVTDMVRFVVLYMVLPLSTNVVERLSGKYSARVMVAYAVRHGEHHLPHGFVRRTMALHQSASARTHGTTTSQVSQLKSDPRRRLLRPEERLPLAVASEGLRTPWKTVYDWFSGVGASTGLGSGCALALAGTREPQRRDSGLSVGKDYGSGRH